MTITDDQGPIFDGCRQTATGDGFEIVHGRNSQIARAGVSEDGFRERVLAALFGRRREPNQFIRIAVGRLDRGDRRSDFGQRPRLVEDDRRHPMCPFQGLCVLDQDPCPGRHAGADHDRRRRGQAEGARARDNEDGNGVDDGERQLSADSPPGRERRGGDGEGRWARKWRQFDRPAAAPGPCCPGRPAPWR